MKRKSTLIIAIILAVFLMTFAGSIIVQAFKQNPSNSKNNPDLELAATLAVYQEREAAYEALIREANAQILQANQTLEALTSNQDDDDPVPTPVTGLTPEEALAIAQEVALYPQTQIDEVELVNFEGQIAYEVKYEEGAIYVDFLNGEVLLNGTLSLAKNGISQEQAIQIARDYLGLESIYQADQVTINGQTLHRIIFNAGHFVYINAEGQVVYVQYYTADKDNSPTQSAAATVEHDNNDDRDQDEYESDDDD